MSSFSDLNVIVVGGGIAGLCAAIGLRGAGHHVQLFEKAPTATAFGAGIVIAHNASKVLSSWGLDYARYHINVGNSLRVMKGDTFEEIMSFPQALYEKVAGGSRQYYAHRIDLQEALLQLATQEDAPGPPVEIFYSATVVSYDPEAASIMLENGSEYTADLIVAADGLHSLAPQHLTLSNHRPNEVSHTGTTAIRFMLPTDAILSDPRTAHLISTPGQFNLFVHKDRNRWMLQYPVRDNTEMNYGMYSRVDSKGQITEQVSRFKCDRESLKRELEGFHPDIQRLAEKTSDILPVWKLAEKPPLPTWYKNRLVLLGDSAHPMLPNQGQGASQCIEDAGALGILFSNMPDKSQKTIASRLELFVKLRHPRASVVQLISHCPYFEDAMTVMWEELVKVIDVNDLPKKRDSQGVREWIYAYDVNAEARKVLETVQVVPPDAR